MDVVPGSFGVTLAKNKQFWGLSSALTTNFTLEITPGTPGDQLIGWIPDGVGGFYFFVRGL